MAADQPTQSVPIGWHIYGNQLGASTWPANSPLPSRRFEEEEHDHIWEVAEYDFSDKPIPEDDSDDNKLAPLLRYVLQREDHGKTWSLWAFRKNRNESVIGRRIVACIWPQATHRDAANWLLNRYFAARSEAGWAPYGIRWRGAEVSGESDLVDLFDIESKYWPTSSHPFVIDQNKIDNEPYRSEDDEQGLDEYWDEVDRA